MDDSISTYPTLCSYQEPDRKIMLAEMKKVCDKLKIEENRDYKKKEFEKIVKHLFRYCNIDGNLYLVFKDQDR